MSTCPICGAEIGGAVPIGVAAETFPKTMRRIVFALAGGARLSRDRLADAVYWDDEDGGPLSAASVVSVTISNHREDLARLGWRIVASQGTGYWLEPVR